MRKFCENAESSCTMLSKFLDNAKSPSRKVKELDNRGSHFYLAMYWAQELANQNDDTDLKNQFTNIAKELTSKETEIINQLNDVQGSAMSIDGYYEPKESLVSEAMRPSSKLNSIIESI
jgi:isocitrate dehydrogenase